MIKLNVEVYDYDTGVSKNLTLPCDINKYLDLSHDLMISDWSDEAYCGFGEIDDVAILNAVVKEINDTNPNMSLHLLVEILNANNSSFDNLDLIENICNSDYMLEEVVVDDNGLYTNEEKCAYYLATVCGIPFAKNISASYLTKMSHNVKQSIDWEEVWIYYAIMGFVIIETADKLYIGNFEDAEVE